MTTVPGQGTPLPAPPGPASEDRATSSGTGGVPTAPSDAEDPRPGVDLEAHVPSGSEDTARMIAATRPSRTRDPRTTFLAVFAIVTVLYVLVFVRGLWWQWKGILLAQPAVAPVVTDAPRGAVPRNVAPGAAGAAPERQRKPLPRTDLPAPRNVTDDRGVTYDAEGVAVMGIDADPSGVYNVPPGRQVRIGGPTGALFDVADGGKLIPAKR